jgi:2,4-dienoyl-CoA reductase-like NADH-dependent reductase (Old Yellow Enzyme family)
MCPGNHPSKELYDYHTAVAKGGVGMTTVAYAAVCRSGLSFERQLLMRDEIIPELRHLTDGIHAAGAKASIQLGHCGNMSHRSICGCTPYGASNGVNLYAYTLVRRMDEKQIFEVADAYGNAVRIARESGFDAVEVHAGHGYLISQFLSPFTNRRHDKYGGTLGNRMRFMDMCMKNVVEAAEGKVAIFVKTNMRDGFRGGIEVPECIDVARRLEEDGAQALVLTGGFVSRAPMYVMRGDFPVKAITHYMPSRQWFLKAGVNMFGKMLAPTEKFRENYFLPLSEQFLGKVSIPLVYVGGAVSRKGIDQLLEKGFPLIEMARPLVRDTDFVMKLKNGDDTVCSTCEHTNFCIGRMYNLSMQCYRHCEDITPALTRAAEKSAAWQRP